MFLNNIPKYADLHSFIDKKRNAYKMIKLFINLIFHLFLLSTSEQHLVRSFNEAGDGDLEFRLLFSAYYISILKFFKF